MISPIVNALNESLEKLNKFEAENFLGKLQPVFYQSKMNLYLAIKELMKDTDELKRLQNKAYLVDNKNYDELVNNVQNKAVKDYLSLYIKFGREFKANWSKGVK
ncbi:MAG TPA: hypothetical protein PL041_02265 [Melioribacteraceae bacterium]|nr:hypothetical protein [Melioribacteraceae bacterium]